MSSNLKVNTILPSTGTTIGIGTVGGLINVVGNIDVNSTSGISTFNDLEIADKIIHTGDTNTAIRFPVGDVISAETNGAERLRITSAGTLLLGTSTGALANGNGIVIADATAARLSLKDTTNGVTGTDGFDVVQTGTDAYLYHRENGNMIFGTNATERLRITSNGALGTNSTVRSANGGLDLCAQGATNLGTLTLGAGGGQNGQSRSSNQENQFRIMMPTYANPALMTTVLYGSSGSGGHDLHYGGGTGWAYATNNHRFFTAANQTTGTGTERARIASDGKLLVGRTNSITITGDGSSHVFEAITDNGYALATHSNTSNKRGIGIYYPTGGTAGDAIRFAIGSSAKFIVLGSGNVQNANNTYTNISDATLKENIVDANSQWDDIKNIKIRNYNFKASTGYETHTQIGVIAQELELVAPKLVDSSGKDGIKSVASSVLYMKGMKALQEAMAKIEILEAEVAALKSS